LDASAARAHTLFHTVSYHTWLPLHLHATADLSGGKIDLEVLEAKIVALLNEAKVSR